MLPITESGLMRLHGREASALNSEGATKDPDRTLRHTKVRGRSRSGRVRPFLYSGYFFLAGALAFAAAAGAGAGLAAGLAAAFAGAFFSSAFFFFAVSRASPIAQVSL
jgi:hypothetical protein